MSYHDVTLEAGFLDAPLDEGGLALALEAGLLETLDEGLLALFDLETGLVEGAAADGGLDAGFA